MLSLFTVITAMQSERSGFVAMCTYIAIVYAFLFDHFLFETALTVNQIIGIAVLVILNIVVIVYRLQDPKSASKAVDVAM